MLEIILLTAGILIASIILMCVLAYNMEPSLSTSSVREPKRVRASELSFQGGKNPQPNDKSDSDETPPEMPAEQPPANRIIPITLFAVLASGSHTQTSTMRRRIRERLSSESTGGWQEAGHKEKAAIIIAVFVQMFLDRDRNKECIEFAYDGEIAGSDVFYRNTKRYKTVAHPDEAEIFKLASRHIADEILREYALYVAKQGESS
ncbi:hypothetical protein HYV71_03135 [Candidatus Uhrbacteria bacterium]|nr:hypothetical protein [Candidatus Uhrbacteria bacterium]